MEKEYLQELNNVAELSDEGLVKMTLENPDAYGFLIERYEEKLHRYILRISGGSREDVEDTLQDVFISAYKNLNDFDQDLKFSSWIYRIAHNKVISHFRKITARPKTVTYEGDNQLLNILASSEDMTKELERKHTGEEVRLILDELDERYREVLVLKFLEEKDYKEISDILEKPMGTVATLINRAKKQFKEKISKQDMKQNILKKV
ncbi:MAG: RNA polymerase sigma-70 factor, ECF subfamily [Candidatus Moranbacteria bacterium GW2011_GWE1_36_7]|nr:MAG: RNA polymerase sigma-70 factor, ECF subfamily [Candidatus Moranbacteria bacterium GW2011_GWD2_36_12]KKQ06995.1 MAG: RNA polymerase sigma-70 factor, ECF subfamily [Candidatus Moranbacteria bacterium GW2011_GWE2_36_40]KKQ15615.1 MAG: RNA polymerase sigma-70 factor, ECF subfamily [Candidatus Moranbacteria bacterium GW2011_GWE1_36_7]